MYVHTYLHTSWFLGIVAVIWINMCLVELIFDNRPLTNNGMCWLVRHTETSPSNTLRTRGDSALKRYTPHYVKITTQLAEPVD